MLLVEVVADAVVAAAGVVVDVLGLAIVTYAVDSIAVWMRLDILEA